MTGIEFQWQCQRLFYYLTVICASLADLPNLREHIPTIGMHQMDTALAERLGYSSDCNASQLESIERGTL